MPSIVLLTVCAAWDVVGCTWPWVAHNMYCFYFISILYPLWVTIVFHKKWLHWRKAHLVAWVVCRCRCKCGCKWTLLRLDAPFDYEVRPFNVSSRLFSSFFTSLSFSCPFVVLIFSSTLTSLSANAGFSSLSSEPRSCAYPVPVPEPESGVWLLFLLLFLFLVFVPAALS